MRDTMLRRGLTATTMLTALGAVMPAWAQDEPDLITPGIGVEDPADARTNDSTDEIVVTGSRLRRNSFDSISPIQVIDADASRLAGLTTAAEFITQSPVVTGAQLDGSVNAGSPTAAVEGVSPGGIGATNISLRGLGPERTLVLVNGRRLAPSGVRGAPIAPDINLVPALAVETVDLLTDGASSIYGSDAVAGVANIILKTDYDGFEISGQFTAPERSGGEVAQVGFILGQTSDRGNVTFSGEYFNRATVLVGDRQNYNDCLRDIEIADNGEIFSACLDSRPDNAVFNFSNGFVFRTPGFTSDGLPEGFSTGADLNARGINFRRTDTYTLQDEERATQLLLGTERYSLFATGDYEFSEAMRFYFEAAYADRRSTDTLTSEQIFPGISATIPLVDENGDFVIEDDEDGNPVIVQVDNPLNPFDEAALPVFTSGSLPQQREADLTNIRLVGGLDGEFDFVGADAWFYDVGLSYDRSYGTATQPIFRENALRFALDTLVQNPDGSLSCGLARTAPSFGFITPEPCVVLDLFNDSNFSVTGGEGDLPTQEQRDYIQGRAFNTTEIEQRQVYGLLTGPVFEMPAGDVGVALGIEYRELEIRSLNDVVRENGLAASEVPDIENDTIGQTYLFEVFGEVELPLHETLNVNASGRFTEEKNFGEEFTYSGKVKFDPVESLGLRATYGTTYRAPNLREQFLAGQAGTIGGGNDPCIVPLDARDGDNNYVAELDDRAPALLAQCRADGADPTALGLQATTGIPTLTGGTEDLDAETSKSFTIGAIANARSFTDAFDLDLAITYWDIAIENSVEESSAAGLLAACYSADPDQAACERITRNPGGTVGLVDAAFVNVGEIDTSGIDYVARFGTDLDRLGEAFSDTELGISFTATQTLDYTRNVDPSTDETQELDGTINIPEWRFLLTGTLEKGPFRALWRTSYIGDGQQLESDPFTDRDGDPFGASACDVLGYVGQCRDVDFVDSYATHDASLTYDGEAWTVTAGVRNLFDEEPPLVDQGEAFARTNIVTQNGYDLIGRRAFLNVQRRF